MKKLFWAILLMVFLAESVAHAHPGHGVDDGDYSVTHYLTEPAHLTLGFGLLVLLLVASLCWKMLARSRKNSLRYQAMK